jgi:uncharacterized protein YaaR (DUF327 family)
MRIGSKSDSKIESKSKSNKFESKGLFDIDELERNKEVNFKNLFLQDKKGVEDEYLNRLIVDIDKFGNDLEKAPSPYQFQQYKIAIRKLIAAVVPNAYSIETIQGRVNPKNLQIKSYQVVKIVDQKLETILSYVHAKNQSSFNIANKIVEIKGLILDIIN